MNEATVLVLRSCDKDMKAYGGFVWPISGPVSAPDWDPKAECGNGLHGLLWGEGDGSLMKWENDSRWLVCRVIESEIVSLGGKVKFPRCEVIFVGDRVEAAKYIGENGGAGRSIVSGTSTSGDSGTSTSGYRGTSTSGDRGTSTSGYSGTSTSGDRGTSTSGDSGTSTSGYSGTSTSGYSGTSTSGDSGTSTSGDRGTSTSGVSGTSTSGYRGTSTSGDRGTSTSGDSGTAIAGVGGVIAILRWNGKRYKTVIGQVRDEDGDGDLEPNVEYRLDENGKFVKV